MRRAAAIALILGAVGVPSASAIESTIYPGVGIGHVRLGMTKAQVERVLGRTPLLNAREGAYMELAWNFGTWTVGFERGLAVQISTTLSSQRTKLGIGPGSTWRALMRAHPGGRCTWNVRMGADRRFLTALWPEYLIGHRGGSQTLYVFKPAVSVFKPVVNYSSTPVVDEVVVRTTFRPLPEFQPSWAWSCLGDWRHARLPGMRGPGP